MIVIHIPIRFIHKILIIIKIELIHSEYNRQIFWLPLFFIGITIYHPYPSHNIPTSRVVFIVRSRNIRQTIFFHLFYDCFPCFCNNIMCYDTDMSLIPTDSVYAKASILNQNIEKTTGGYIRCAQV